MKLNLLSMILLFLPIMCSAQSKSWTLQDCIEYAQQNNITIKQYELSVLENEISVSGSKWAYAPDISATNSYTFSRGRVLDPTTYQFIENQSVIGNNTSVGISTALFNGFINYHQLKRSELDFRASLLDLQKVRNDVRLNVTALYLKVLSDLENIIFAEQIFDSYQEQKRKTERLVEAGKVTIGDLLQIESEIAQVQNTILTARNSYEISRLHLCQVLEIDDFSLFQPEPPGVDLPLEQEYVF